jgi:hypothetical protein
MEDKNKTELLTDEMLSRIEELSDDIATEFAWAAENDGKDILELCINDDIDEDEEISAYDPRLYRLRTALQDYMEGEN